MVRSVSASMSYRMYNYSPLGKIMSVALANLRVFTFLGTSMAPGSRWPAPILLPSDLDDTDAPDALVCPITQELMTEPALVITTGRTFQRDAITRWISENGTCPLRRNEPLSLADLAPNLAVRQMVESWARERCGGVLPPQPTEPGPVRVAPSPPARESPAPARPAPAPPPPTPLPPLANLPDEAHPLNSGKLNVLGVWHKPGETADGRFFRFDAQRLGLMLANRFGERYGTAFDENATHSHSRFAGSSNANPEHRGGHVKNGGGAVLRCVNTRTGKSDAVLVWDVGSGETPDGGFGCWNPSDYAAAGDWRTGDVLIFPDLTVSGDLTSEGVDSAATTSPLFQTLCPSSVDKNTGTGWNLVGTNCLFGKSGVVGDWWRALELEFTFGEDTEVGGLYTDVTVSDEVTLEVFVLDLSSDVWVKVATNPVSTSDVESASTFVFADEKTFTCRKVRARWETTDLHKLGGLSTARSGGGLHAHPVGPRSRGRRRDTTQRVGTSERIADAHVSAPLAVSAVRASEPAHANQDQDGWWSPKSASATEISRAARASLQDRPDGTSTRFPNI